MLQNILVSGVPVQKKMAGKLKLQETITKTINKKNEEEMRTRAISKGQKMSTAQLAVTKHHETISAQDAAAEAAMEDAE